MKHTGTTLELLRRGYRVVERESFNAVLREQGFQQKSGMVDQATAVRIGKLAGARALIIVNVYNTSSNYHQGFQGGMAITPVELTSSAWQW